MRIREMYTFVLSIAGFTGLFINPAGGLPQDEKQETTDPIVEVVDIHQDEGKEKKTEAVSPKVAEVKEIDVQEVEQVEEPAKIRPIQPADYGKWESLGGGFFSSGGTLSPDGKWIAYQINRVNGKNELRVRMLATDEDKIYDYGGGAKFSDDSNWLAYSIGMSEEDREKLQKQKKPVRNKLGLLNLSNGEQTTIENVASSSFSDDGKYLIMRRYKIDGRKSSGVDIVLRNLETSIDTNFGNVSNYSFNDEGTLLAMVIDAEDKAGNGIQLYDASTGLLKTLDSSDAKYKNLTWREDTDDLAVLREIEYEDDEDTSHTIHAWSGLTSDKPVSHSYNHTEDESFPQEMRLTELAGLRWSDDGATLFFGIKEWENKPKALDEEEETDEEESEKEEKAKPEAEKKKEKKDDSEKPLRETIKESSNVEVWHAKDIDIIPRQKRTQSQDKRKNYLSALWLAENKFVQLGDDLTESVTLLEGQKLAIGSDNTPYEEEKRFGPTVNDIYVIDVNTGEKNKVLDRVKFRFGSDPIGKYFTYVRDNHIWTYDLQSGKSVNLTQQLEIPFINQEASSLTDEQRPYGVGGWTKDGTQVLLYSRYDMYLFHADGSGVTQLTHGTDEAIRYRRVMLDFEEDEFIDTDKSMYVSLYGDKTKKSGYARLSIGQKPEELVWLDQRVSSLDKADDTDVFIYTEQDFDDSSDIFLTDALFDKPKQITETNPFQNDYLWGRSELIDYTNVHGQEMQGALFYPADYEEGKQYPMIVYIYELRSQFLRNYSAPSERSAYNTTVWTSEGYFVYQPDIVYRPQNPGLSAVECLIPAVEKVLETGMIDPESVGLTGHSWGAYQTAFVVTQTDLFAAGVAGAPLTNMMSMSMSIYWNSGMTDAWIFHESQGRMDQPFWQDVETYMQNSPIFSIDNLKTPLMIAFGTEDGAVDFNQGVEMYNAARLAQKDFVMLVYPGENHGLRKKENQVDYHYRILEWFGHYLKGEEAPAWITEGQSWLDRQKEIEEKKKK